MATAKEIEEELEEVEEPREKSVKQYLGVPKLIDRLFEEMNEAEGNLLTLPIYLTRPYDELKGIAIGKGKVDYLRIWLQLDTKYGALEDRSKFMILEPKEFRERKQAIIKLREDLGMGTTEQVKRDISRPLRLADYHKCPLDCPELERLREDRRKWQ